jgi:cell division protein FtsW
MRAARTLSTPVLPPQFANPPLLIFILTMTLVVTGIVMVYSASSRTFYFHRQLGFAGIGLAGLLFFYHFDYTRLRKVSTFLMLGSLAALLLVLVVGPPINGARRWLPLGIFNFQPSELAKLALAIYMAKMLTDRRQFIKSFFSGVLPACIVTGAFMVAIIVEPDFGAAMVLGAVIFGMWIAAEMRWFHLLGLVAASLPAVVFAFLMHPFRMRRLLAFLYLDEHSIRSTGLQLYQSLVAVGSGGALGRGVGESVQKFYYLPERHTDFIFAIMGEELGFFRMSLIVAMFAALTLLGWWVAMRSTDLFGSLLAAGITLMIFVNATINMGVVLGILPTTGMVLPFISYGGTGLVIYMSAVGILMNIARSEHEHQSPRPARA